jgi:hypothetical protein
MKKNYEKLILALCALAGAGVTYLGYSKNSSLETDFEFVDKTSGKSVTAVDGAAKLTATLASVNQPVQLEQAKIGENKRPVDNFVGVSLFAKKPAKGEKVAKPVDPVLDAPIHPPIPNLWWLENRLDPGFGDSPNRDEDNDGFTNLEEYESKTSPVDAKIHPALINKLKFVKYDSVGYFVWFSSSLGADQYQFKIAELPSAFELAPLARQEQFLAESPLQYNRTKNYIGSGANIFEDGLCAGRYRLKSVSVKEVLNEATNLKSPNEFAIIEDLAPHKGDSFEIPKSPSRKDRPATVRYDRTAVLELDAIGQKGKEFKVLENGTFSLPEGDPQKAYRLVKISPTAISVEFKDSSGATQTIEIKKN